MRKQHDLAGRTFNDWKVLHLSEYKDKRNKDRYWECECKCGKIQPVRACYLKNGMSKRCRDCGWENQKIKGRKIPSSYWSNCKRNASKRKIEFSICKDDVIYLLKKQSNTCFLSGLPIRFAESESDHLRGETTASIDRIDSSLGYTKDNIQLVHKTINFMKRNLSDQEFVLICEAVVGHQT
ncbi:MAG: hypothetical protein OPY06_05145 [Nitrosopumilus sp.]|nr:hypothetical protein [Nitrosopumilus sp.]